MKNRFLTFLFILSTSLAISQNNFIDLADSFLKKHVSNGLINYQAIQDNPLELFELLNIISLQEVPQKDNKAYLINAYNILVISTIVESFPILSPEDVPGFFVNENHVVAKNKMSLNQLEKNLLFKVYDDPRLHFVLVCGAIGCPPITNFAYQTSTLDTQLDQQTKLALNSDFIRVNNEKETVSLSEIFRWYAKDFGGTNTSALSYINNFRDQAIPNHFKIGFYTYNWKLNLTSLTDGNNNIEKTIPNVTSTNLQTFTAGSLLRKKQFDITVFNTLYTESKSNWLGTNNNNFRNTFVTHLAQITYGISKNKRINIGLDLNFRYSGTVSNTADFSGISEAFRFTNSPTSRVGLTAVGLRLKVQPFKSVSDFSIQSTIQAPTINNAEGNANLYWADWDRITWWNQLFYTKSFGDFQLFTEIDFLFRFKKYESQIGMLDIPLNVFLSYFPTSKLTIYGMTQHVPRFTNKINPDVQTDWVVPMNYTASGLGAKFQVSSRMNLEVLYTNFWRGTNTGLGNTFNFGIKYISK